MKAGLNVTSEVPLDAIEIGERFEPERYSYSVEAQRKVARAFCSYTCFPCSRHNSEYVSVAFSCLDVKTRRIESGGRHNQCNAFGYICSEYFVVPVLSCSGVADYFLLTLQCFDSLPSKP